MTPRILTLAAAFALAACAPKLIPNTQVEDTRDNRAVYEVLRAYVVGLQTKDASAVLALVSPDYFDNAGTPLPTDDMDRAAVERSLATDLAKVDSLRLEMGVKRIDVKGDTASAELFYDGYYRVVTKEGPVPKRESDLHQMKLRRHGQTWLITSGL